MLRLLGYNPLLIEVKAATEEDTTEQCPLLRALSGLLIVSCLLGLYIYIYIYYNLNCVYYNLKFLYREEMIGKDLSESMWKLLFGYCIVKVGSYYRTITAGEVMAGQDREPVSKKKGQSLKSDIDI